MWQIILQILAVIGIILLVLIGLTLLLVCLILFVPLRYRALADIDTSQKKYSGNARVTWLLRCITLTVSYPQPAMLIIRVFGFPVKKVDLSGEEEQETEQHLQTEQPSEKKAEKLSSKEKVQSQDEASPVPEPESAEKANSASDAKSDSKSDSKDDAKDNAKSNSKDDLKNKTKEHTSPWYEKILYTIRNLCDKIKEIWNNIKYYKDLLNEKANRELFARCKKRIAVLLKGIAPKRIRGNVRFGTGSPDTTGYLMGLYGMLIPYLDKEFYLDPDFEEAICQGTLSVKGRIYLITILVCVLRFVADKQLFVLLKKLKREEQ